MDAHPERALLSRAQPEVYFWDQPLTRGPRAFSELVDAAAVETERLARENGGPIRVLAHSFGGNVLRALLEKSGALISEITLYNCGLDWPGGFLNLLRLLGRDGETMPELRARIDAYANRQDADATDLWSTLGLLAEDPAFMRLYWPRREDFSAYAELGAERRPLDFETLRSVLNEFLSSPLSIPKRISWKGGAKLFVGEKDPLGDAETLSRDWRKILPQIEVETVPDSGHFTHLEPALRALR